MNEFEEQLSVYDLISNGPKILEETTHLGDFPPDGCQKHPSRGTKL